MTNGGLLQLVAYGAQDVYLTANPQVTFFKQLYRRHSNFAMESIEQTFNGVANFGKRVTCTIARNGDLIHKMYLQATLPSIDRADLIAAGWANGMPASPNAAFAWIPFVGQYLIRSVEIEIGGQRIDKQYGDWLHIWNELTLPAGRDRAYLEMVNGLGGVPLIPDTSGCDACAVEPSLAVREATACANPMLAAMGADCTFKTGVAYYFDPANPTAGTAAKSCMPEQTLMVPLEFWFNRHAGLALPLIALQYHEVKVNIEINELRYLVNAGANGVGTPETNAPYVLKAIGDKGLVGCSLFVDYIYLDTEERRRFAQVAHEYLIEQLQFTGDESVTSTSNKIQLSFNHPVKELVWVVQQPSYIDCNAVYNCPWRYSDGALGNPVAVAKLQLNGQDRFQEREGKYFNYVQPYQHHTATPSMGINVYSFALKPEDLQPSGSCNFSRIDNAVLNLTLTPNAFKSAVDSLDASNVASTSSIKSNIVRVYATNYNVLRIMSGMGGLAYSN